MYSTVDSAVKMVVANKVDKAWPCQPALMLRAAVAHWLSIPTGVIL